MPWTCRLVDPPVLRSGEYFAGTVDFDALHVGEMAFYHLGKPCAAVTELRRLQDQDRIHLSAHYFAHNSSRPPLILKLPGDLYFLVDGQCYSPTCTKCGAKHGWRHEACPKGGEHAPRGHYDGWKVSGTPPRITVEPSIHYPDYYHGWLKDGVISDDCDGRKFDAAGKRIP